MIIMLVNLQHKFFRNTLKFLVMEFLHTDTQRDL